MFCVPIKQQLILFTAVLHLVSLQLILLQLEFCKQRGRCFSLFSVVFTPFPPSHQVSVWVLPVISLLLANTVLSVQACLMHNHMMGEITWDPKKEDDREPLLVFILCDWRLLKETHAHACYIVHFDGPGSIPTTHTARKILFMYSFSGNCAAPPILSSTTTPPVNTCNIPPPTHG